MPFSCGVSADIVLPPTATKPYLDISSMVRRTSYGVLRRQNKIVMVLIVNADVHSVALTMWRIFVSAPIGLLSEA
jgi:hypothetical protein